MTTTDVTAAVETLLRSIPEQWQPLEADRMTSAEERALGMLVAAGLVERRTTVRMEMARQGAAFEATITVTGEFGLAEALDPVLAELWARWSAAIEEWRHRAGAASRPFRVTKVGTDEWRLTEHGVMARADLDTPLDPRLSAGAAMIVGSRERVFDFVLKEGSLADRPPVPGSGRLVALRPIASDGLPVPAAVALTNAVEVAAAFREAFAPLVEAALRGREEPPDDTAPGEGISWEEAMREAEAHVRKHGGFFPGRNELARLVRCSPSTMAKAIKRSTYLRARAEESKKARVREVQLGTPMESAPADDDAPRRSDVSGGESEPAADPVDAYHAGGDDDDERDVAIRTLAAQQRAELMREERQRRRAAKDGKLM